MRLIQTILIVAFATLSFTLPLQSNPEDLEDAFVRLALQKRGDFSSIEKSERDQVLTFCSRQHYQLEQLARETSDPLKQLIKLFQTYSPEAQILRTCMDLPKILEEVESNYSSELEFWKDRLKYMTIERTNNQLAHFPFQIDTEGKLLATEKFKTGLASLQKQLQSLANFMADLKDILNGGISNKTEAYDDDIFVFSAELLNLKNNPEHIIDPALIQKMKNRPLAISGTLGFNDKIIGFCSHGGDSLAALDKVFPSLKARYTSLVKILKEIDPDTNENDYFGILADTQDFVGFHGIAQEILGKYQPIQEALSKKRDRIERQLKLHHLLNLKIRSTIQATTSTDFAEATESEPTEPQSAVSEPTRRLSSSDVSAFRRMSAVLKRKVGRNSTSNLPESGSASSSSSEDPKDQQE